MKKPGLDVEKLANAAIYAGYLARRLEAGQIISPSERAFLQHLIEAHKEYNKALNIKPSKEPLTERDKQRIMTGLLLLIKRLEKKAEENPRQGQSSPGK